MGTVGKRHQTPGAVGYVRVSTEEQATSGLSLESQRVAIDAECHRRRLPLLAVYEDAGVSSASLDRPGLARALEDLAAGAASALMVAKLDRLSRSVHDASGVMLQTQRQGWGLIALDVAVDTTTPQGEAMAHMASVFAQLERRLIGQRTADALAVKKAQGVRLGRPLTLPIDVADRILGARARGDGWTTIARALNDAQVPTARGGRCWYPSSVRAVVLSRSVDPEAIEDASLGSLPPSRPGLVGLCVCHRVTTEPPKPTQPAEGPLHHSPPGTVANRDTIDGVAPGGSQRGLRPPS